MAYWQSRRVEKKNFPPPLNSLSEKGRRNFTLRSERKDGRLEIVRVMMDRPEILCASRENGRLELHLIKSIIIEEDEDDDQDQEMVEDQEENDDDDEEEKTREERERGEEKTGDERENEDEEKRGRKILQRCYAREMHVWGEQLQQRCLSITTM